MALAIMDKHDALYFQRRADEARAACSHKGGGRQSRIAGHLALAYTALARRKQAREEAELSD